MDAAVSIHNESTHMGPSTPQRPILPGADGGVAETPRTPSGLGLLSTPPRRLPRSLKRPREEEAVTDPNSPEPSGLSPRRLLQTPPRRPPRRARFSTGFSGLASPAPENERPDAHLDTGSEAVEQIFAVEGGRQVQDLSGTQTGEQVEEQASLDRNQDKAHVDNFQSQGPELTEVRLQRDDDKSPENNGLQSAELQNARNDFQQNDYGSELDLPDLDVDKGPLEKGQIDLDLPNQQIQEGEKQPCSQSPDPFAQEPVA